MSSLDETFKQLVDLIKQPEMLNPAKSDPFFYFVHDSADTLVIKQKLDVWSASFRNDGWTVERISLANLLWQIIDESGRWEEWLQIEPEVESTEINDAVRDVLREGNSLVKAIVPYVQTPKQRTILFITDTAVLHPYFRSRAIETGLHDRVKVPTVMFYLGTRSGQYGLHFLGFYPVDGNYRSTLLGG
jgi:BREX protein BrxB